MGFEPQDPAFEQRVRASFAKQGAMGTMGAQLAEVAPGRVAIEFIHSPALTQQHDFVHAGFVAMALDSACGYAAFSLMPADAAVLTIEFKVNLLRPAAGTHFVARGEVIRAGRTISFCEGKLASREASGERLIATMSATLMTLRDSNFKG